jgi:hypothetical protein
MYHGSTEGASGAKAPKIFDWVFVTAKAVTYKATATATPQNYCALRSGTAVLVICVKPW